MPNETDNPNESEMRQEYDFETGVRGKYAARFAAGSNVVVLSEDVARHFPDSESVNRALRACREIITSMKHDASPGHRKTGS